MGEQGKDFPKWDAGKLRTFKGFENYSDERALKVINSIDKLARILLPIVIENIRLHEQSGQIQQLREGEAKDRGP